MKLVPRPYQAEAVQSVYHYFQENTGNPVVALPTGTGKSVIIAMLLESIYASYPSQRVMVLTHVKELIEQNYEKLVTLWPNAPAGIYSAGIGRKDYLNKIIFAGIASAAKNPKLFGWVDLVIIDEAHLVSPSEETMYRKFLDALLVINPHLKVIGTTATPWRLGHGPIVEDGIFTDICFDLTSLSEFNKLIQEGYLLPLIPKQTKQMLDTSGVHMRGGEFISSELQAAVDKQEVTFAAVKELVEEGADRKHWLVFATGIQHAINISEMLESFGITSVVVHSNLTMQQRDTALEKFKNGEYQAAVNVGILTTGFDFPGIDLIAVLRPTASTVLWVQMLGRGTRPLYAQGFDLLAEEGRLASIAASEKQNCIAEGQLVLTDTGLIPIEKVTKEMQLWDGVEYVSHQGLIYKGEQNVIHYAGLTATEDHKVWTKKGWQTLRWCSEQQTPISVTGIGRTGYKQSDNYFRSSPKKEGARVYASAVQCLRNSLRKSLSNAERRNRGMQALQSFTSWKIRYPKMVDKQMYCRTTKMLQPFGLQLSKLWRKGNSVSVFRANSYGSIYAGKFWLAQRIANQQNQQQWPLRSRKPRILHSQNKYEQPTRETSNSQNSRLSNSSPRNSLCRRGASRFFSLRNDRSGNNRTVLQEVTQTKRHVWDLCNAGPRNRFTCQGLLVSNCLVLDFAGNTARLGPINDPVIPRKKGKGSGEAPVKLCGSCATYNHAGVTHCVVCGAEFTFQVKLKAHASTQELIKDDSPVVEVFKVDHVTYSIHRKVDKPDAMKVTYYCGLQCFTDYVCFEHEGFAQRKARQWWRERMDITMPLQTKDAMELASQIPEPTHLRVWINKKYPEILSSCFDGSGFNKSMAA